MIVQTRSGRRVSSPYDTDDAAARALHGYVTADKLDGQTKLFAQSLLWAYNKHTHSTEQMAWIHIIATQTAEADNPSVDKIPFDKVTALLGIAGLRGLRSPRLHLQGMTVTALPRGDVVVYAKDSRMLGRVSNSELILKNHVKPEERATLLALSENPVNFAIIFGKRTGCCLFCSKMLTTPESVGSGYGPVCADKYNLPWSESNGAKTERSIRKALKLQEAMEKLK